MGKGNIGTSLSKNTKFKNFTMHFLMYALCIISIITTLNCAVFYWFPVTFPFSSYSAVKFMLFAFLSRHHWFALPSFLICALMFLTALSVRRQSIVFPIIALIYFLSDFIMLFFPLIDGLKNGLWIMYITPIVVTTIFIVQLCFFCWNHQHRTA